MYALYAPNLPMYPQPLGIGAALPATSTSATLAAGIAAVRRQPCYSHLTDECVNTTAPSSLPDCEAIRAGYKVDAKSMDVAFEAVKFCPAPGPSMATFIAVGAVGIAVGILLGGLMR